MKVIQRRGDQGYLDRWLWVPKTYVSVDATKSALTHVLSDGYTEQQRVIYLWKETRDHLLVPRSFWDPAKLPFTVVDCRPQTYPHVRFGHRIKLDHRMMERNGKVLLCSTGKPIQKNSIQALRGAPGGVLQLACVAGDTELRLNRGGKGFRTPIATAYKRWANLDRYAWDSSIPTHIRSDVGGHIGLNEVLAIIPRGERKTFILKLEDGRELRLTEDHEVRVPTGYRELRFLRPGDEVVVDGPRSGSARKKKLSYRRRGGFQYHPFSRFQTRSWCIEEHRAHHSPGARAFGLGELHTLRVRSITPHKVEPVYDIACRAPHNNFTANGIVVHNCGKGKTVVALYKIATTEVPALVMVDNINLLYQWKEEAETLLDVPGGIGIYGDGKKEWKKGLVLATYHSVANWSETITEEQRSWFGQIFWDEGHHVSAPIFAKTADMFYGPRYSLTATPERDDGMHVVSDVHIGPVLYKDLTPTMIPNFAFLWSGLSLDVRDPTVASKVLDTNGEVHISKVNGFFGQWISRLQLLLSLVDEAESFGRTVLLLSNSVDEVVNLMALYEGFAGPGDLYTDIPTPTPQDIGETLTPVPLQKKDIARLMKKRDKLEAQKKKAKSPAEVTQCDAEISQIDQALKQHEIHKKIQNELAKRQKVYIRKLIAASQRCGLLTYDVPPAKRQEFLDQRSVIFAVTKYGKEGMNCPRLDTVILSSLFSSRNGLQQLMGRPTRPMPGKKTPTLLAVVDEVGQCIGMSKKLMQHLREWPKEEGGPYTPHLIGYPKTWNSKATTTTVLFGQ